MTHDKDHTGQPSTMYEMVDADGVGLVGTPGHGDFMKVWIKVRDDHIEDISFICHDCESALAGATAMCRIAVGMNLDEAAELTGEMIVANADGLDNDTESCADLSAAALYEAVMNYVFRSI
jgi:nitrogen fixation NifU-like protein